MQNEAPAKQFAVQCFSDTLGVFVDHAAKCYHETRESAMGLIKSFKCVKWQLQSWSKSHNAWVTIKSGDASKNSY